MVKRYGLILYEYLFLPRIFQYSLLDLKFKKVHDDGSWGGIRGGFGAKGAMSSLYLRVSTLADQLFTSK